MWHEGNRGKIMGRAETFEHTADLGLRVVGDDLADLFQTAAGALFDAILANRGQVVVAESESVSLAAESPEDLLIAWLNELIFRSETQHRVYGQFDVRVDADGRRLTATIGGEPIDRTRHLLDHEVKAATRHGLCLRREGKGWLVEVVLDI
jgi:SHS2 domain-containing protein